MRHGAAVRGGQAVRGVQTDPGVRAVETERGDICSWRPSVRRSLLRSIFAQECVHRAFEAYAKSPSLFDDPVRMRHFPVGIRPRSISQQAGFINYLLGNFVASAKMGATLTTTLQNAGLLPSMITNTPLLYLCNTLALQQVCLQTLLLCSALLCSALLPN
jgi:hypothetical protein